MRTPRNAIVIASAHSARQSMLRRSTLPTIVRRSPRGLPGVRMGAEGCRRCTWAGAAMRPHLVRICRQTSTAAIPCDLRPAPASSRPLVSRGRAWRIQHARHGACLRCAATCEQRSAHMSELVIGRAVEECSTVCSTVVAFTDGDAGLARKRPSHRRQGRHRQRHS